MIPPVVRAEGAPQSLAAKLRAGTRAKHRLAEETPFVQRLLAGAVGRSRYGAYLESLYFVYAAMESALDLHRGHAGLGLLDLPALRRVPSLEEDLAYWRGPAWRASAAPSEATRDYAERIREVTRRRPLMLAAHLYTRYLGDLSGGQLLARAVERAFGLPGGVGSAFYRFGSPVERARLKERYRAQIDALPVDAESAESLVAEARVAFEHNVRLFEELGRP